MSLCDTCGALSLSLYIYILVPEKIVPWTSFSRHLLKKRVTTNSLRQFTRTSFMKTDNFFALVMWMIQLEISRVGILQSRWPLFCATGREWRNMCHVRKPSEKWRKGPWLFRVYGGWKTTQLCVEIIINYCKDHYWTTRSYFRAIARTTPCFRDYDRIRNQQLFVCLKYPKTWYILSRCETPPSKSGKLNFFYQRFTRPKNKLEC